MELGDYPQPPSGYPKLKRRAASGVIPPAFPEPRIEPRQQQQQQQQQAVDETWYKADEKKRQDAQQQQQQQQQQHREEGEERYQRECAQRQHTAPRALPGSHLQDHTESVASYDDSDALLPRRRDTFDQQPAFKSKPSSMLSSSGWASLGDVLEVDPDGRALSLAYNRPLAYNLFALYYH
jgi:hypothetical protein